MGAGAVTRFPLIHAFFFTHVQAKLFSAEVRAGDCGGAGFIAEAILALYKTTRTVHLGAAEQSFLIPIVHT